MRYYPIEYMKEAVMRKPVNVVLIIVTIVHKQNLRSKTKYKYKAYLYGQSMNYIQCNNFSS